MPSSADRSCLVRWCSFGSDTLEADQFQLDIQARLDSVTLRTDSRGHPDPDWMASEKRSKLRPHSVRSDIPDQTGRHQTGHSNSGWAAKASDRTFQLQRNSLRPDIQAQTRQALTRQPNSEWSNRGRHPSPERTSQPWLEFPRTSEQSSKLGLKSLSQTLTPSGRKSRLRPSPPVQTRRIISDWTVPARTSKFILDI